MNSPFMRGQAAALLGSVSKEPDVNAKVRAMYRKVLARDPGDNELALARAYLANGTMTDYAHALLCTNEVIYWP
jgi:cytochrome c-type biogenesis protein CcmH/NrfG